MMNNFLKNIVKYGKKVEKLMRIDFKSKSTYGYDDKYIKTKIKTYADIIITNFHNKKMPKEKVPCKCLSIIMLDSVIESDEKYYAQTFLEECKYVKEKIKFEALMMNKFKIFQYNERLIVCVNHALLGFYFHQFV